MHEEQEIVFAGYVAVEGHRREPEPFGHALDRFGDVAFRSSGRIEVLKLLQRLRGQRGSGPRSKILGGEIFAADGSQIIVDVLRSDVADSATLVDVLE